MTEFLAELRRRHIFRIGGIYVVVAWGITQVLDVLSQMFALPDWIAQPSLVVLTIGFPVVLIAAWTIVGAAQSKDTPAEVKKATATDWALIATFVAVLGFMGYQQFSPSSETASARNAAASIAGGIVEDVAERPPNSIAVLPFENVSPDPDDAYFAVGVHEEIINQLSKLRNVNVIARNSVMQYEGGDVPIPEIATQLNVETVMRGSVRYAGNEVRLTAQLIDGMTNLPVWTTEDQGDLSDIFAIQSDIAMSIANSLQAEFSIEEQESIEAIPTNSPEAYTLYLRASESLRDIRPGDRNAMLGTHLLLDNALELDPDFALAYAAKAEAYWLDRLFAQVEDEDWLEFRSRLNRLIIENAQTALALDPSLGAAHAQLAILHFDSWQWGPAQEEAEQALRLSPNDPAVLLLYSDIELFVRERPEQAIGYAEQAIERDPNNAFLYRQLAQTLRPAGRYADAVEAIQQSLALDPVSAGTIRFLAVLEYALGNNEEALEALRFMEQVNTPNSPNGPPWYGYGYGLLGQPDDAQRAFERLQRIAEDDYVDPGIWACAYMGIGDYEEALIRFNEIIENPELIRRPVFANLIRFNYWNDPRLEEPEWVDARDRLVAAAQ